MAESPQQAARRLAAQWFAKGYKADTLHTYRDADGQPIYYKFRLKHSDGTAAPEGPKVVRPMRLNGAGYVLGEPKFSNGKPLYGLHLIAADPNARIWVVEGEKAADALTKLAHSQSRSGGADSAKAADWKPLAGRNCILWADNDDAGRAYMGDVAALLIPLDCKLSAVNVDAMGLPAKGDAADWLASRPETSLHDLDALPKQEPSTTAEDAAAAEPDRPTVA